MGERASQHRYLRPLGALALLVTEYLAISFVFDANQLVEAGGFLGGLGWMGLVGPAVMAFGTSLWILASAELVAALKSTPPIATPRFWSRLAIHLVCFASFVAVTATLFGVQGPPASESWAWVVAWILMWAGTVLSVIPIAFGIRRLVQLVRELAAPIAFSTLLAFLAVAAGLATVSLWDQLSGVTLDSVAAVLDALVSPIYFDPETAEIGTPDFWVEVAPICSGYEGIGLILVFLSAYLVVFRKRLRFPNVLVLIPAAIILMWLLNVMRIVALILVGHFWSADVAIGGFHSKAGWLVFCSVALGAVWLTQTVSWFASESSDARHTTTNPSAPFLLPLLAVVATTLVTGLFVRNFDYFYPLRVVVALLVLAWYRDDYLAGFRQQLRGRPVFSRHAIGIGVAVYVLWITISAWTKPQLATGPPEELGLMAPPLAVAWIAARALGSIVTVPLTEELAFRGFLLRRLIGSDFKRIPYDRWSWPAVLISSVAFAAVHQQWIGGFAAGVLYAYAQKRRGLLSDAIVAHAVTNVLISVEVLVAGHWSLW